MIGVRRAHGDGSPMPRPCSTYVERSSARQVPVRDLSQQTADVLARVERGERIEVTRNGVTVAITEPARPNPLSELIEAGEFHPAQSSLPLFSPDDKAATDSAGLDAVLDDRRTGERHQSVIYLDTSAAMKLVRAEAHSHDLSAWLAATSETAVLSSVLVEIELIRATRRSAPNQLDRAAAVLRGIGVVTLSPPIVARASAYAGANLRSPDAIHLAAAEHLVASTRATLDAFVAYDDRLLAAANHLGLPTLTPGAEAGS